MKLKTLYGLPPKVIFCKRTLISNQRPNSAIEFQHNKETKKKTLYIDKNGISDSWKFSRIKKKINFLHREKQLLKLLAKHRGKHGEFDCVVPSSGGKDSCYAAHILKFKYGMNPLTVTWAPTMYTDYGYRNFKNLIKTGKFTNITSKRNESIMRFITKQAVLNLLHPFQTFILGQKNIGPRIAAKYKIPLVFYGESEAEYGSPIQELSAKRDTSYWVQKNINKIYLAGIPIKKLMNEHKLKIGDLKPYLPLDESEIKKDKVEVHYLGYYKKWIPQESFYYSVEHSNFKARPYRSQGTYSKYISIDDKIDDLHHYTTFIKFGIGRTSYDASQEIRNKHLTREEAVKLVSRYDGEYPDKYLNEVLDYLEIKVEDFNKLCDKFRSPHLWQKTSNGWKLRHTVYD